MSDEARHPGSRSPWAHMTDDARRQVAEELRNVALDGGRQRVHPSGAAAGLILLLVFTGIGFLAGWITGAML